MSSKNATRDSPSDSDDDENDTTTATMDVSTNTITTLTTDGAPAAITALTTTAPRVKRKKAKRACNNCQRAHLTCDDDRPCKRCITRGLSHDCQDGTRKKAKYLFDAPDEALREHVRISSHRVHKPLRGNPRAALDRPTVRVNSLTQASPSSPEALASSPGLNNGQTQSRQNSFAFSPGAVPQTQVAVNRQPAQSPYNLYNAPQNDTNYNAAFSAQPQVSVPSNDPGANPAQFDSSIYGQNDLLGNFDFTSMNFENRYGAMEFSMLSQMSSGFNDPYLQVNNPNASAFPGQALGYGQSADGQIEYTLSNPSPTATWPGPANAAQAMLYGQTGPSHPNAAIQFSSVVGPFGYAIGSGISEASPGSVGIDPHALAISESRMSNDSTVYKQISQSPSQANDLIRSPTRVNSSPKRVRRKSLMGGEAPAMSKNIKITSKLPKGSKPLDKRRRRDVSAIYAQVTMPYPYTAGFHAMTAVLQRRFSSQKLLIIAKALASIRPSFMSCTKTLIKEDLIFMERCFQRQLVEYEDHVDSTGTPTLICRRTGEIAYVGEEFTALTGWRKEVLLGHEPNLNINKPAESKSGSVTASSTRGFNTPRLMADGSQNNNNESNRDTATGAGTSSSTGSRYQAVFLPELLDDDSVIQFYQDFAKLAFADSKGKAMSPCKLVKYKTKEDNPVPASSMDDLSLPGASLASMDPETGPAASKSTAETIKNARDSHSHGPSGARAAQAQPSRGSQAHQTTQSSSKYRKEPPAGQASHQGHGHELLISGEEGLQRLGEPDGRIDCMYCWTVKRDVFDIPMLVVINFLPIVKDWPGGP